MEHPPTKNFVGAEVPDTALVRLATSYARKYLTPAFFNHVQRCLAFGFIISDKMSELGRRDREAHALATVLHDLGFDPSKKLATKDNRCEVDSANAAIDFIKQHGDNTWTTQRLQLVWDAIALHAIGSIAFHKEPEVKASTYGIWADFQGPDGVPGGLLTKEEYDRVVSQFPRLNIVAEMTEAWAEQCRWKPDATYDTAGADIGEKLLEGYRRKGHTTLDFLEACSLDQRS